MIKWLLITSVTGSIVSLLLILFKRTLVRRLGGSWYYYACLLTLVLFVLPIHFPVSADISRNMFIHAEGTNAGTMNKEPAFSEKTDITANPDPAPDQIAGVSPSVSRGLSMPSPVHSILVIWMCGFVFMLSRYFLSYFRFKHKVIQRSPIDKAEHLDVVASDYVHSPMLIGFIKPTIVIPNTEINKEDYKLALLHELNHYKQGDAWIKLFAALINSLHWFNPVTYLAVANISEACEYSCDEKITKHMEVGEKKNYSEMILTFASHASPALSSSLTKSKKQLYRRFELILKTRSRNRRNLGALMVIGMIAISIITTSLVFAEAPKPLVEYGGAITTYYNTDQTLDENVRDRLGIKSITDKFSFGYKEAPFYIDVTGRKVDYHNRTEPYYKISREWKQKNTDIEGMLNKTLSIEGKTVSVAFADNAAAYKDDPVIEQMIRNQITFELSYQSKRNNYDHPAFINELIERGVYVIQDVTEPKDFQFEVRRKQNGDEIGWKPLTSYDKKNKLADIFNDKTKLLKNIDGNQGTQLGNNFVIKKGETLAIDIKETTDKMPTVSWAIVNVTTGELVDWFPAADSGYRYIYTPGQLSANYTFKVVMSGEESDSADIEIFTFKGTE